MKLLTERERIKGVSKAWDEQYQDADPSTEIGRGHIAIGAKLRSLNLRRVSAATVANVIGNPTWTQAECAECHQFADTVIEFCEDTKICENCIKEAARLLRNKP